MKTMLTVVVGALACIAGFGVITVVVVVAGLQSGLFNSWIEDKIAANIGLAVTLGKAPALGFHQGALTLDAGPIRIENADWAEGQYQDFAQVETLHAGVRLWPLLRGQVVLPEVEIAGAELHLARSAEGEVNWPASEPQTDQDDQGGGFMPEIERLVIQNANVTYSDPRTATDVAFTLDDAEGHFESGKKSLLNASGRLQGQDLRIEASGAPLEELVAAMSSSEPTRIDADIGGSTLNLEAASFKTLHDLNGELTLDAEATLARMLTDLGVAVPDSPPFTATMQVEPGERGSIVTAKIAMEGDELQVEGEVNDLSAPLEGFMADIDAEGSNLTALLGLAGIAVEGELPPYRLTGRVSADDGPLYRVTVLEAVLGDNRVTGEGAVRDLRTLDGLRARLKVDAADLAPLLTSFKLPEAERFTSAKLDAAIDRTEESTNVAIDGDVSGDRIEIDGRYEGAITAFRNPKLDLLLEGSAFGALPEQFDIAARPIESYRIDALIEERDGEASPTKIDVTIEDTRLRFDGTIDEIRAFKGIEGQATVEGPNPAGILELFELPAISLPPYRLDGKLTWRGDDITIAGLDGKVGDSDARGDIAVDLRPEPVAVKADLRSDRLDFDDLAGLIGASPSTGAGETAIEKEERQAETGEAQEKLLPTTAIDPANWENLDLDVRYEAARVDADNLPIDRINLHVVTDGRWLTLDPLETGLADGTIVAYASLDGTQDPMAGNFDIRVTDLQLQDFLAKLGVAGEGLGEISGRTRLEGQGQSVDQLLSTSNGTIALTMSGGKIDALILEGVGLDIAEGLAVLFDGSDQANEDKVPIRCAVANFEIKDGVARANPIVLDTPDSKITAQGEVNLKSEEVDIFVESHPKDSSLLSANQPIRVEGKLFSPSVGPAPGKTKNKVLGWVLAPLAALAPFFDAGDEKDSPCAALIEEARQEAKQAPEETGEQ